MSAVAAIGLQISGAARKVPTWPVYLFGIFLGAFAIWDGLTAIDPVEVLSHNFGMLALRFLLASLCITPLLRFARINLVRFRKALGLLAFGFLTFHFLVWIFLDLGMRWGLVGAEIVKRPYLAIGFIAFILLVPLAATSWQAAFRKMGAQAWARLHRLVYVAVILGAVHFVMQEKVWTTESLIYLAIAVGLVGLRFTWIRHW
ncbi:sulfoxide reductase heme-binding subunit YedZ [Jannaschia faecimaris]|uniref:Protein-methionine-sulfoxide reductase heme-binding subunit MsrQ n=1 Tax=Jannaschia faecimaris TaxID=1244108 RepID=A0A1H3IHC5_9RHOB|nr:protein-methionine-sulfoxide reductase heme-binding subunit MsrQ [Jannaschia faecimaris]SDY26785.1 sulfoxide reductase heme-binding subunit YedZ [Jannaschia faecimaris]